MQAVLMDYEGEPVYIKDGTIYEASAPRDLETGLDAEWNSETCEWEFPEQDFCDNDAKAYGLGWYDCNTDWRTWR